MVVRAQCRGIRLNHANCGLMYYYLPKAANLGIQLQSIDYSLLVLSIYLFMGWSAPPLHGVCLNGPRP